MVPVRKHFVIRALRIPHSALDHPARGEIGRNTRNNVAPQPLNMASGRNMSRNNP
jgi:hypothetical protein